jgi:hypothetical protein
MAALGDNKLGECLVIISEQVLNSRKGTPPLPSPYYCPLQRVIATEQTHDNINMRVGRRQNIIILLKPYAHRPNLNNYICIMPLPPPSNIAIYHCCDLPTCDPHSHPPPIS